MATTEQVRQQAKEIHHLEKPHPTTKSYVRVALFLSVVTGIEIALSYVDTNKWALLGSLVTLGAVKFYTVVFWFMHLKFDHPTLRKPFGVGIVLALVIYSVVLGNLVYHSTGGSP